MSGCMGHMGPMGPMRNRLRYSRDPYAPLNHRGGKPAATNQESTTHERSNLPRMRDEDGKRRHPLPDLRVSERSRIHEESSAIQPVVCYIGRFVALFSDDKRSGEERCAPGSRCDGANCDLAVNSSHYRGDSDNRDIRKNYLPSLKSLLSL